MVHSSPVDIVKEFQDADLTKQQELNDRKLHEYLGWATSKNKAAVLSGFVTLAGYLSIIGIFFVAPVTGFAAGFDLIWLYALSFLLGIPFLFWYIGN